MEMIYVQEYQRMRFEASIHGVDLDKEMQKQGVTPPDKKKKEEGFGFKSLEYYEKNYTMEERVELTKKMMSHHMSYFGGGGPQNSQFGINYQEQQGKGIGIG